MAVKHGMVKHGGSWGFGLITLNGTGIRCKDRQKLRYLPTDCMKYDIGCLKSTLISNQ